jgi:carboxyl-terminal processing protease
MPEDARIALFDQVWGTIDEGYLDDTFNGVDWAAVGDEYAPYFLQVENAYEVYDLVREMVALLDDEDVVFTDSFRMETLTPEETQYVGIGALVDASATETEGMGPRILYVFPGSGAEAAGLKARDRITAIDGDPCPSVRTIRGPEGTTVTLGIASPGEPVRDVSVERRRIDPTVLPVVTRIGPKHRIGYLRFPSMEGQPFYDAMNEALAGFVEDPVRGLIIDVRSTTRGGPGVTLGLMSHLMTGTAGSLWSRLEDAPVELPASDLVATLGTVPLVILVDGESVGEAERLAMVLQSVGRATIVGVETKGVTRTIQDVPLDDGSTLTLPTIGLQLPDGRRIVHEGVVPDVVSEEDWLDSPEASDPGIEAALRVLAKATPLPEVIDVPAPSPAPGEPTPATSPVPADGSAG